LGKLVSLKLKKGITGKHVCLHLYRRSLIRLMNLAFISSILYLLVDKSFLVIVDSAVLKSINDLLKNKNKKVNAMLFPQFRKKRTVSKGYVKKLKRLKFKLKMLHSKKFNISFKYIFTIK